jgi:hypothetical protein
MRISNVTAWWFTCVSLVRGAQLPHSATIASLLEDFAKSHWRKGNWKGASSWTGDNASRLMINYLTSLDQNDDHGQVDDIFIQITSRALNRWTILQYLTQGYDDFGWTTFCLLDLLDYTYQYETRYPRSKLVYRLPLLRKRVIFRAAFLHDVMEDSWSPEICGGGAEWKVRGRKLSLWPSVDLAGLYKNSITNHLYNANNAHIYNATRERPQPIEITEVYLYYVRLCWKLIRPAFGWSRSALQAFSFTDQDLIRRAQSGLEWMAGAQLLTNDSLYMDGQRLRFRQDSPVGRLELTCDATVHGLFTYNQVAGIRARRHISRATGDVVQISIGHREIQNLIRATYSGRLGSSGILEDACDRFGNCTQDMQIFKGLPFLDIKNFCESVEWLDETLQAEHLGNCTQYRTWIETNAAAAMATVDASGRFGGYWGSEAMDNSSLKQTRSIETQVAGLAVVLTSSWFDHRFT